MFPRSVPYENSPPPRDNIVTVGMPGVTSTRAQMSRYTGGDPVTVLRNWADDPHDALYELEKDKNRFSGMSYGRRLRRAARLWNGVVFGCKSVDIDSMEEEETRSKSTEALLETAGGERWSAAATGGPASAAPVTITFTAASPSASPASFSASEPTFSAPRYADPALEAADKGLVDPPVLYQASCRVAPRLIHGLLPSPEVNEMHHRGWYRTCNPLHWLLVGKEIITSWWFCVRPFQFCYSESGRSNMGGQRDQAAYTREVHRAIHKIQSEDARPAEAAFSPLASTVKKKKKHLVLFGVSRGATTCFYSAMKLSREDAQHVSLVLVEAPFDTLQHVTDASSATPRLLRWFFRAFCDWRGTKDEAAAYDFDPQQVHLRCPVAFVLSTKDRRVPNACTQALIDRVRSELVPHVIPAVEVLTLQHSRHPCMAVGHKEDQDAYVAFVEDLYRRYCPP